MQGAPTDQISRPIPVAGRGSARLSVRDLFCIATVTAWCPRVGGFLGGPDRVYPRAQRIVVSGPSWPTHETRTESPRRNFLKWRTVMATLMAVAHFRFQNPTIAEVGKSPA